jgi:hypothetical protein
VDGGGYWDVQQLPWQVVRILVKMNSLFDLSQLSFEEFISFFFDHDITTEGDWYQNPDFDNFSDWDDDRVGSRLVLI